MPPKASLLTFLFFTTVVFSQQFPIAKKTPSTETKHGISYTDEYNWLENMRSEEVSQWVDQQNAWTESHKVAIEKSYNILSKIREYDTRTTYSLPDRKGKYFYSLLRKDKKKAASLFFMKTLDDEPIEIVNPTKIYPESNVNVYDFFPSRNSAYLAYKISINGSDRQEIRFVDLFKNRDLDDVLEQVKFSQVAWNGDRGIFYKKNSNTDFFAKDSTFKLFYHKLGTKQIEDELVFDASKNEGDIWFFTNKNKLFLVETNKEETKRTFYHATIDTNNFTLAKLFEDDIYFKFLNYHSGRIYYSSKEYNWGDVKSFAVSNKDDQKSIIPQLYNNLLMHAYFTEHYIICKYKNSGANFFNFYNYDGTFVRKIDVPSGMDVVYDYYDEETRDFYFGVYSYVLPFRNFKINILTGAEQPFFSANNRAKATLFPINYFETKTISYQSRDNVMIPITIIYKKGMLLDGNNPTLLKAYGGFGVVSSPSYDTGLLYFLEKGGVFAYPEIRGGGEKGKKWHTDGKGLTKMNTFNDFIDAAEFLIKEKYTSANKLAITGASQGGLLVGVAMTKRPDLFKVAIPKVGLFDMVKFQNYTTGKYWLDEYGDGEKENEYKNLLDFSPFHNIKEDVNYPTTLIITSENDDRVPPLHSYKFAAKLQNRAAQKNPIYLKTIKQAGHYGNYSTYEKRLNETADFYNFLLYHLNQ